MAIQYAAGTKINATFVGDTELAIVDNIKAQLLNAGWTVVSGASGDWVVRCIATPVAGLQVDVRLYSSGGYARVKFQRTGLSMTQPAPLVPSDDLLLLPLAAKTFRIIANRHQFFALVPGSSNVYDFCCGGVPYVESFQGSYVAWCHGNGQAIGGGGLMSSFRTACSLKDAGINLRNSWQVSDSSHLVLNLGDNRCQGLDVPTGQVSSGGVGEHTDNAGHLWHNDEAFKIPARLCYGVSVSDDAVERGQIWDAVVVTQAYPTDYNPLVFDSHNWYNLTVHGVEGNFAVPSLFLVIP